MNMLRVTSRMYRRLALVIVVAVTVIAGVLAGLAYAHDPRLDSADAALVKANALVDASECDCDEKKQREFDKHRERAMSFIDRARDEIAAAAAVADAP